MENKDLHTRYVLIGLFFASGISGLVYEVVWARMLSLIFGSTIHATITILVAYMGGLSYGSYFGGRVSDRVRFPVFFYGLCELGIGLFALIFPFLLNGMNGLYSIMYSRSIPDRALFVVIRFILISILLMVPTSLMGATLPALSRGIVRRIDEAGRNTGFLYAVNTIGAVFGVGLAAFIGIEKIGLRNTTYAAAALNIAISAFVIFFLRKVTTRIEDRNTPGIYRETKRQIPRKAGTRNIKKPRNMVGIDTRGMIGSAAVLSIIVYAVSGFCALSLEVLWTRELVFLLGMDTYAFGTMLSVFLFGLGIGSSVMSWYIQKVRNPLFLLGVFEAAIGLTTFLNFILVPRLYTYKQSLFAAGGTTIFSFVLSGYVITLLLMIVPTLLMGAAFPLVTRIYTGSRKKLGRSIGKIYSFNTLGSILGSLFTGFLFIPVIGVVNSFKLIIILNITLGASILFLSYKRFMGRVLPILLYAPLFLLFVIPFEKPLVGYSYIMKGTNNKLLYYAEDAYAAVSVLDIPAVGRRLYVDSGLAADTSRFDMPSHKIIVHLPLLLQKNPEKALVIGFGMGETSYSITTHGVQVDAVEISKGEIAANKYFLDVNHNILENPLFHLTIDDGRNYLLTHEQKYDLISVGIIHPGISANSAGFYGLDFYEMCRERLTDEGIISQWVPTHGLSLDAFKTVIRTFVDVFPHSTLWFKFTDNFVLLLGSKSEFQIDYRNFIERMNNAEVFEDLETIDMTNPLVLLDSFWMDSNALTAFAEGAVVTGDDHPVLEFMSVKSVNNRGIENLEALAGRHMRVADYLTNVPDEESIETELDTIYNATEHLVQAQIHKKKFEFDKSIQEFDTALLLYPDDANAQYLREHTVDIYFNKLLIQAEKDFRANRVRKALSLYEKASLLRPDAADVYNYLGICYSRLGDTRRALTALETAVQKDFNNARYHFNRASLLAAIGDYERSRGELEIAVKLDPDYTQARDALEKLNNFLKNR